MTSNCSVCDKIHELKSSKCKNCKSLEKSLKTVRLKYGSYVIHNNKRYFIDKGFAVEMCPVYYCNEKAGCPKHFEIKFCSSCLKFHDNTEKTCQSCTVLDRQRKNKLRLKTIELKNTLGGKCIMCGDTRLYCLEFDHIDPAKKIKQITKMQPNEWDKEIRNIQLLCGNCHRIKSVQELREKYKNLKNTRKNEFKKVDKIKIAIGKCQICGWSSDNKDALCSVLEFDHINDNKVKQVSVLGGIKARIEEIVKCRAICRACHQITTCLQRGGIMLQLQMTPEEYQCIYDTYMNSEKNVELNQKVIETVKLIYPTFFDTDTFYCMSKLGLPDYKMNHFGEVRNNRSNKKMKVTRHYIMLVENGVQKMFYVLELYAKMFIPNPNNYTYIKLLDKERSLAIDNVVWTDTIKVERYVQYSLDRNVINIFFSPEEASVKLGIDPTNIRKATYEYNKKYAGYYWQREYIEETNPTISEKLLYKYYTF